jgi:FMN-dependent NADH-azoreductase
MAKLIHIQASPRVSRSASQAVASCFIKSYCAAHSGDTVDTLDLWQTELPEINGAALAGTTPRLAGHRPHRRPLQVGRQISRFAADVEFQHPV